MSTNGTEASYEEISSRTSANAQRPNQNRQQRDQQWRRRQPEEQQQPQRRKVRASTSMRGRRRWVLSLLFAALSSSSSGSFSFFSTTTTEALQITTFNLLAAVHRSMPVSYDDVAAGPAPVPSSVGLQQQLQRIPRESERREWWVPRAEGLSRYVADELSSSDVVLLQEWWFSPEFEEIFDKHTGHLFDRAAERRPGREDGMAVLINKIGKLELVSSASVLTGPQRIAQIAQFRERTSVAAPEVGSDDASLSALMGQGKGRAAASASSRLVTIANAHLSFPGEADPVANARRQAMEVQIAARALDRAVAEAEAELEDGNVVEFEPSLSPSRDRRFHDHRHHLQIIGGDFNSNSLALPALRLESSRWGYVNSATATAALTMASGSIGGMIDLGVTHRTHRGEDVSVDHIFARTSTSSVAAAAKWRHRFRSCALRGLGYLDEDGTRISFCRKRHLQLMGEGILSDHRPVSTVFEWPPPVESSAATLPMSLSSLSASAVAEVLGASSKSSSMGKLPNETAGSRMAVLASIHPLQSLWDSP